MTINLKPFRKLNNKQINELVFILNNDQKLIQSLGNQQKNITVSDFTEYNQSWSKKHSAQIFAILDKNIAIGTISLSHINNDKKTANIGY